MRISTKARILRAQRFDRMERFAETIGVRPYAWKRFESGMGILAREDIEKAAAFLGVKASDLADDKCFPLGPGQ